MKISFDYPLIIHPNSDDLSVVELARILEKRNEICLNFSKYITKKLNQRLINLIKHGVEISELDLQSWIKNEWAEYGLSGKFGKSLKAIKEGRQPFIDTGTYMEGMQPFIIWNKEELKYLPIKKGSMKIR